MKKPRVGAIAYNEQGQLGLVQADGLTLAEAQGRDPTLWEGIALRSAPGESLRWAARNPRVVAYMDQVVPPAPDPAELNGIRCGVCDGMFSWAEAARARACPRCFTTCAPENPDNDITIRMNWEEARLLALFAHSWATQAKLPSVSHVRLERFFAKLRRARPEGTLALLEHEVAEEQSLEESLKSFADRLTAVPGGRAN